MRMLITTMALLVFGSVATAQTGNTGSQTTPASSAQPSRDAPVGHRQPRAGQAPSEKNLSDPSDAANRENAALDRKIRSICRGC